MRQSRGGPLDELRQLDATWGVLHNLVQTGASSPVVLPADERRYPKVLKEAQILYGRVANVLGTASMEQAGRRFDAFQHVLGQPNISGIVRGLRGDLELWRQMWTLAASAIAQAIGRLEAEGGRGGRRAPEPADAGKTGAAVGRQVAASGKGQKQYFVAHEFTRAEMDDLRKAIAEALAGSGLKPYYADKVVREGHVFKDKIVPKIRATRFGIYDVSNPEKPNVFMELGAAIGMRKRYFIICRQGTKLPSDILGLDRIEYESYAHLTRELKAKIPDASGESS